MRGREAARAAGAVLLDSLEARGRLARAGCLRTSCGDGWQINVTSAQRDGADAALRERESVSILVTDVVYAAGG